MTPARWVPLFLEAMAAERGAAANTLAAYDRDLAHVRDWLTDTGQDFASASEDDITAYLVHCDTQGLSRATRAVIRRHSIIPSRRSQQTSAESPPVHSTDWQFIWLRNHVRWRLANCRVRAFTNSTVSAKPSPPSRCSSTCR